jgi:hypothetical protein
MSTLEEIREAILRRTEAERIELLNWMLDTFDMNEAPIGDSGSRLSS